MGRTEFSDRRVLWGDRSHLLALQKTMGNILDTKPTAYSRDVHHARTYGDYMQTYTQNRKTDSFAFGSHKMGIGVKILQDVDTAKKGELYVNTPGGRKYITYKGNLAPYASDYLKLSPDYGNGPAVLISGDPLNPKYTMFYAKGGDRHQGDDWTAKQVTSLEDVRAAITEGDMGGRYTTKGKFSNYYGQAAIDPFGLKEGRNADTALNDFGQGVNKVLQVAAIPLAETALDEVVPFASNLLQAAGVNDALQQAVDALSTSHWTPPPVGTLQPGLVNAIKDPRLASYARQVGDQSQQFVAKYGPGDYKGISSMAADTPSQIISKARAQSKENLSLYTHHQVNEMQSTVEQLKKLLPPGTGSELFANIQTGLDLAQTDQQRLNVIGHFSKQIGEQLMPALQTGAVSAQKPSSSGGNPARDLNHVTASAQVGHPTVSINGTDSKLPHEPVNGTADHPKSPTASPTASNTGYAPAAAAFGGVW